MVQRQQTWTLPNGQGMRGTKTDYDARVREMTKEQRELERDSRDDLTRAKELLRWNEAFKRPPSR